MQALQNEGHGNAGCGTKCDESVADPASSSKDMKGNLADVLDAVESNLVRRPILDYFRPTGTRLVDDVLGIALLGVFGIALMGLFYAGVHVGIRLVVKLLSG